MTGSRSLIAMALTLGGAVGALSAATSQVVSIPDLASGDKAKEVYGQALEKGFTYHDLYIGPYLIAFQEGDAETMQRMAASLAGKDMNDLRRLP